MQQRKIDTVPENGSAMHYEPATKLERVPREIDRTPHEVSHVIVYIVHVPMFTFITRATTCKLAI